MKHYENKRCKIHICRNGKNLFYDAIVDSVNNTHISFKDKFKDYYSFRIEDIVEIRTINN